MICCLIIASSHRVLFQTIPFIFLFSTCNVCYWKQCHRDNRASAPVVFPINASKLFCKAKFNFSWVWKRTCWNRNRWNWNELNKANIAVTLYGKKNWYISRELWRMYQLKCILRFAPVFIHVMLVIIRWYQLYCVNDYNHVHYIAYLFWSRYAYSRKHHAMLGRKWVIL